MKIFTNHRVALATGIILALVVAWALRAVLSEPQASWTFNVQSFGRWLHIGAGVFWIGLLYYFNAVQVPAMAVATADTGGPGGAGINKYVAPRALWWFRWSALITWLVGAWLLEDIGPKGFINAFTLSLLLPALDFKLFVIGVGQCFRGFDFNQDAVVDKNIGAKFSDHHAIKHHFNRYFPLYSEAQFAELHAQGVAVD